MSVPKQQVLDAARAIRTETGAFKVKDAFTLCAEFGIPFKTMLEQYLEGDMLPTGIYGYIMSGDRTFSIRAELKSARERAMLGVKP